MCVLCSVAGKAAGGDGCLEIGNWSASETGLGDSNTNNAPELGDEVTFEIPGADGVPGSTGTGLAVANGSSVRGYINTAGDQDWYRIDLVAGHQYTFAQNGIGRGAIPDSYLRLFNASGVEVLSDDDSGPLTGAKLTFTASATGTYYISAGGYTSNTGQYILTMNEGASPFMPVLAVNDVADYLTNTYWEVNGTRDRHWGASPITFNVDGLEPERAALARLAFQSWSEVANLTFTEVHTSAQMMLDDTQAGAYSSSVFSGSGLISSSSINVETTWYGGIDAVDSYTYQTFMHEIGHAIGLGHAGPYNGSAAYGSDNAYANDTWQLSVMSYFPESNYLSTSYRFTMTPMMADILAVQQIYGATATRAGDTTYGFGSTAGFVYDFAYYSQAPALTIYDYGGSDTLNASGYGQNQLIDLRAGSFSNIGGLTGNIGVFLTSVIENAVGGSGHDTIIGNDASNTIRGNGGNDSINGGGGTDFAVFSGMRSAYTLTSLGGTSVRVVGPDGTDTLTSVERLVFSDQTLNWPIINQPDLVASNLAAGNTAILPGGSTTVSYTISNGGTVAAGASTVGIYLSHDGTFDGSDTLLTTRATPALAGGASFNDSFALTLPTAGAYFLLAVADYTHGIGNDFDYGNNPSNAVQMTVIGSLTVTGGAGSDALSGGPVNDFLNGMGGNDTLTGGAGNDSINGGAGDDTAVFSQGIASYSLADLGTRITVSGADGNDTLTGIEHLRFADGTINVVDGSTMFDTVFYMSHYPDVFHAGGNALAHFNGSGWHEGRDPNPFFSTTGYLNANPDVRASGVNPLDHYHQTGWQQGRDPGPNFDTTLYLVHNPDVARAGMDPLEHYLQNGMAEGRTAFAAIGSHIVGGFDAEYYIFNNPDVARAGIDPLTHYNTDGWHEGRNPNAWFDTAGYLAHYTDIAAAGVNPLMHYESSGWREGRNPSAQFDTLGYLTSNPDIAAANINPLDHFMLLGIYEGRTAVSDGLWH